MHSCDLNLNLNELSKIEGHADLDIAIKNGQVANVDLRAMENKRFYTQAVQGKPAISVPQLVSRICGTCSVAHLTGCIEAVEKTLDIQPSEQTLILRKLMMHSLMIRDHALHLYFFVLPDLYGVDSILELAEQEKELVHEALHIKEAGNNLSTLVAGRAVHAPFEQVGGFSKKPDTSQIPSIIKELKNIRDSVRRLVDIFYQCEWELKRDTTFVALAPNDFSYLEGVIKTSQGTTIKEQDYWNHLHNVVLPYSQAQGLEFEGQEYMVGSLARINLNADALHDSTKADLSKYLEVFPSSNVFHNNLAQAIEIMHGIDHSIELLTNTHFSQENKKQPQKKNGEGVGVVEAPRGTLYYWMGVEESKIRYINLVIPTAQNLINMKADIESMVKNICSTQDPSTWEADIRQQAQKVIRAYDPCMSCASHFLKINWA